MLHKDAVKDDEITKVDKQKSRVFKKSFIFHLDGLALCGVVPVLDEEGVLERSFVSGGDVDDLASEYRANSGYLNVFLRMLCSQGLLKAVRVEDKIHYRPAVGNESSLWYTHSKAYATQEESWMKEIVNHWNDPDHLLKRTLLLLWMFY